MSDSSYAQILESFDNARIETQSRYNNLLEFIRSVRQFYSQGSIISQQNSSLFSDSTKQRIQDESFKLGIDFARMTREEFNNFISLLTEGEFEDLGDFALAIVNEGMNCLYRNLGINNPDTQGLLLNEEHPTQKYLFLIKLIHLYPNLSDMYNEERERIFESR